MADEQKYEILHRWSTRRGVDRSVGHNPGDIVSADEIEIDAGKDKGRHVAELLSLNLIRPVAITKPAPLPSDSVAALADKRAKKAAEAPTEPAVAEA